MRASGATAAMRAAAVCDHRYSVEDSPARWSGAAAANSAMYSSSVCGVPSGRGGMRSRSSVAKNHGSLLAGI